MCAFLFMTQRRMLEIPSEFKVVFPDSFVEEQDTGGEVTWWLVAIIIQVHCYEHVVRFTF